MADSVEFSWASGKSPDDIAKKFARLKRSLDVYLRGAMETAVLIIEATAKKLAPYEHGRLRASIASEVRRKANDVIAGVIGSDLHYAPYQEEGTRYMSANPYLQPAIEMHIDRVVDLLQEAVNKAVREAA